MTVLEDLKRKKPEYEAELISIVETEEVRNHINYEFRIEELNLGTQDLEVAVIDDGKIIAGHLDNNTFTLVTNLEEMIFREDEIDTTSIFEKHKELLPKLGIDAYKEESASVVRLKDGRIVSMLSNGRILER